jgi:Bacterial PH domain
MPPRQEPTEPRESSSTDWQAAPRNYQPAQNASPYPTQPDAPTTPPPAMNTQNNWQTPVEGAPTMPPVAAEPTTLPTAPQPSVEPRSRDGHPDDDMYKPHFSRLNLSAGEKVVSEMKRHPIGVLQIYISATAVLLALLVAAGALIKFAGSKSTKDVVAGTPLNIPVGAILGIAGVLALLIVIIAAISIRVYRGNRLYLTNESVIQRVQNSLFDVREQQISLSRIDDVTFEQRGMIQQMFNYGTLRLSTEGEETTYYFHYAMNPREEAANIINAQEDFEHYHAPHRY